MKQFLIFLCGALSIMIAICGVVCAIQTIATGEPFLMACALIFATVWAYMVLDWFKSKYPEKVADEIYNKLNK